MKEQELNTRVSQTLQEFESMENIQPSAEWNDSLMQKLSVAKPNSIATFSSSKYAVVMLFVVMANIGFVFTAVMNDSPQAPNRDKELQTISKELLSNPSSINN